ncbi:hypothetical protein DM40_758 [Burkholderia cenocepacia]|nr:hypothetical protein DM40_758 [Burkholderia cenocepacia]
MHAKKPHGAIHAAFLFPVAGTGATTAFVRPFDRGRQAFFASIFGSTW